VKGKHYNKLIALTLTVTLFAITIMLPNTTFAAVETSVETAIIVDVESGRVLYDKNADEALPPASMTKMMTEYIVLEKVNDGELDWEDTTEISDYAYDLSADNRFSGIGLRKNVEYKVKDLYDAMAIYSDNATTVALAEMISGSEGEFVKLMNQKGEELGLPDFKFVNATGLDNDTLNGNHPEGTKAEDTNLLSARSAALLAYHLVVDYPEVLEVASIPSKEFDGQMLTNYNWMLKHDASFIDQFYYEGVDGLKTGNTELAGKTFTGTAEKDGRRLITVVMKADSEVERFQETAKLLDYGFDDFEQAELLPSNSVIEEHEILAVTKGKEDHVNIATAEAIDLMIEKGTEEDYSVIFELDESKLDDDGNLEAPVKKGDKVGQATITYDEKPLTKSDYLVDDKAVIAVDVIATEDVEKKNWFSLTIDSVVDFFKNLF